jgi:hypothetical protein
MDKVNLDRTLTAFETGLNYAGYVPILSSFSAPVRAGYGKIEIICGVAAAAIFAIRALLAEGAQKEVLWNKSDEALEYVAHGLANIIRAVFELVPFVSLVTCLPYDLFGERFSYTTQTPIRQEGNRILIG